MFNGAGTMGVAGARLDRRYIGIEQHEKYCEISGLRIKDFAIRLVPLRLQPIKAMKVEYSHCTSYLISPYTLCCI